MEAMAAANRVDTAYDGDALSQSLDAAFSELFETECEVVWIPTGTAANSIILAHFVRPWQGILCYEEAHIEVRSEEHTSELQSLMRISYAVFCLQKQTQQMDQRK